MTGAAAARRPPPAASLVDAAGRPVPLGAELGRGGEGTVYEIEGAPEFVAKRYHIAPDARKSAKLAAMARAASPALTDVAAWPTATLHALAADGTADGAAPVVGLVMPRASGAPVHRLYSPLSRRAEFPAVDWRRLVIVAHNLAAAVAQVHAAGHVVGDVNQGNVLVARDGRVRLIDCDSFQVCDPGARDSDAGDGPRWFPCEVGVAHFTPPELQGHSFAGVVRTPNHDAFGLAVLAFHLLFLGRHPFAGRYAGPGDLPIERAIAEFRFAFGRDAAAARMSPPPHALPLADVTPDVAELFERAFGREGVRDGARPTAAEWSAALGALARDAAICAAAPRHSYARGLDACPWCAIARAGGPDFFAPAPAAEHRLARFNAQAVLAAILGVPSPAGVRAVPAAPATLPRPTQPVPRRRRLVWEAQELAAAVAVVAFLTGKFTPPWVPGAPVAFALIMLLNWLSRVSGAGPERGRRARDLEAARARLGEVEARWRGELGGARGRFAAKRRELEVLWSEHQDLDSAKHATVDKRFAGRRVELEQALAAGPAALRQLGDAAAQLRDQLTREIAAQQVVVATAAANVAAADRVLPGGLVWLLVTVVGLFPGSVASLFRDRPERSYDPNTVFVRATRLPPAAPADPTGPSMVLPSGCDAASYCEFQVETPAAAVPGTLRAAYPERPRTLVAAGSATVQFVVDTTGSADLRTIRVLGASDSAFAASARVAVVTARFSPAQIGGRKVRQLVQLPFTFTLAGAAPPAPRGR